MRQTPKGQLVIQRASRRVVGALSMTPRPSPFAPVNVVEIAQTLEDADPVGLVASQDIQRMAQAILAKLASPTTVSFASLHCPGCGRRAARVFAARSLRAVVLDVDGFHDVRHVPRRCQAKRCALAGKTLWANFVAEGRTRRWLSPKEELPPIVMMSPKFGVARRWYEQYTRRILKQYASFWGEAEVHWRQGFRGVPSRGRQKKLLVKTWGTLRWLERAWGRGVRNVELLLNSSLESTIAKGFACYYAALRARRASCARRAGVRLDVQILDGHQKWQRRVCCLQRSCQLRCGEMGLVALIGCCDTPKYKSKFCARHASEQPTIQPAKRVRRIRWKAAAARTLEELVEVWVGEDAASEVNVPIGRVEPGALVAHLRDLTIARMEARAAAGAADKLDFIDIPDEMSLQELASLKCTTHKLGARKQTSAQAKKRTHVRSGGLLVSVTHEGFVTDAFEFMGSESCTQRYFFLARLKHLYPELRTLCHDDACHLRRYAQRWADASPLGRPLAFPALRYVLDRFHAGGHTDPWCIANVHPLLPENAAAITNINSSACEVLFHWLARYKHVFRKMGRWTGNFYAQEVIELRNDATFARGAAATLSPAPASRPSTSSSTSSSTSASSTGSV